MAALSGRGRNGEKNDDNVTALRREVPSSTSLQACGNGWLEGEEHRIVAGMVAMVVALENRACGMTKRYCVIT